MDQGISLTISMCFSLSPFLLLKNQFRNRNILLKLFIKIIVFKSLSEGLEILSMELKFKEFLSIISLTGMFGRIEFPRSLTLNYVLDYYTCATSLLLNDRRILQDLCFNDTYNYRLEFHKAIEYCSRD